MSHIIKFNCFLNENVVPNITKLIKQTSKKYREENSCTNWDINNGLCDDFANEVIREMGGYSENLYELSGDMFFNYRDPDFAKENWDNIIETEYGVWSKDMLEFWGYPPIDINNLNDEINHVWIYHNGKHYDAEAPNGVEKWYNLPLIKKLFNGFK
jgi:hypothetical protein